jgi:membrane-associated protein
MLGFFLGQVSFIEKNIELAAIVIVAISVTPIALEMWKARQDKGRRSTTGPAATTGTNAAAGPDEVLASEGPLD